MNLIPIPFWSIRTTTALLTALGGIGLANATPTSDWHLVWGDEFSVAGTPDPAKWGYENGFVRNNELQWYQPENASCADGLLVIEARREQLPNPNYDSGSTNWRLNREFAEYTSASLRTKDLFSWQYGRLEVRAKIDVQSGMWPAIWTLGASGEWPSNGECDVLEYYSGDILANTAWGTAQRWTPRWDSTRTPLTRFLAEDLDWVSKFHVWRMDWDPDHIRLYLDDQLLNVTALSGTLNADGSNPFHQPHYLILNLAVGSNGGNPSSSSFPARYEIDWVRLYNQDFVGDGWVKIDDRDAALSYSGGWGTWDGNPGHLGTETFSETTGSTVRYTFTGSRAQWFGMKRNDLGHAEIILDGVSQGLVDCYSAIAQYDVALYETPELPDTLHTLEVRVAGTMNPASTGHEVIVDALASRGANFGEIWQRRWFTETQIRDDPEMTAAASDHDGDGIPALVESLFGGDPLSDESAPPNTMSLEAAPGGFILHHRIDRLVAPGAAVGRVEISSDLANWSKLADWPGLVETVSASPRPGYEQVDFEIPLPAGLSQLFLRKVGVE